MAKKKKRQSKKTKILMFKVDLKKLLIWIFIVFMFIPGLVSFFSGGLTDKITVSQAMQDVRDGKVQEAEVVGNTVIFQYSETEFKTMAKEEGDNFGEILERHELSADAVSYTVAGGGFLDNLGGILNILSFALMAFFFVMIFRQAKGSQSSIFGFGKSKAKLFAKGKQDITFNDVAGVDEAKRELEEIVDFLKHPKKYRKLGARTPKGVLLIGPAGVGKTLMARAVAGEAGVAFFSMAGSEFMEMLVGVGASRVRDLFDTAKKTAPSIIFIDEIDAIGRTRGYGAMGGHDEREQTLNQILVEMDGFAPNDNVVVIAATNRPDVLDQALVRPGRFDRRVMLDMPDIEGRKAILKIHAKGKPFKKSVDWDKVARRTVGFSGADLENMLNEAAIGAAREGKNKVDMDDLEEAATKVKMGPEKKRMQSEEERKMTAYHEAGHALVSHFLAKTDPVHRISIVSRGMALGYTLIPPVRDKYQRTRTEMLEQIAGLLGGRVAEQLVFDELTGGAASDIDKVTRIARAMVVDYGMSKLGPIDFGPQQETTEWGKTYMEPSSISEAKRAEIDLEVNKIVVAAEKTAIDVLKKKRKIMDKVVERLMKIETVEGDEFEKMVGISKEKVSKSPEFSVKYTK